MFGVAEPKDCLRCQVEDTERFSGYLHPLEESVSQIHDAMLDGTHGFDREDLQFIEVVRRCGRQIPFRGLLEQINQPHRRGWRLRTGG